MFGAGAAVWGTGGDQEKAVSVRSRLGFVPTHWPRASRAGDRGPLRPCRSPPGALPKGRRGERPCVRTGSVSPGAGLRGGEVCVLRAGEGGGWGTPSCIPDSVRVRVPGARKGILSIYVLCMSVFIDMTILICKGNGAPRYNLMLSSPPAYPMSSPSRLRDASTSPTSKATTFCGRSLPAGPSPEWTPLPVSQPQTTGLFPAPSSSTSSRSPPGENVQQQVRATHPLR